jgi:hypothetical protein
MGYGLEGWVSIPGSGRNFSYLYGVQTGSGAQPASYPIGILRTFFPYLPLETCLPPPHGKLIAPPPGKDPGGTWLIGCLKNLHA